MSCSTRAQARPISLHRWGTASLTVIVPIVALGVLSLLYTQLIPAGQGTAGVSLMAIDAEPAAEVAPLTPPVPADVPAEAAPSPEPVAIPVAEVQQVAPEAAPVQVAEPAVPVAPEAQSQVEPEAAASEPTGPTFDGRPLRKARELTMLVTAYSPDARSCGKWADGITASGYSVWTNGMKLVAADTSLLPFGTVVSIPGYNGGRPVPVLDRGGKIKGHRLDVLYPTHERALQWGARRITVTVWEYAD